MAYIVSEIAFAVSLVTTNAIAESMYTVCDEKGDHILLFDAIVDHRKNQKMQ